MPPHDKDPGWPELLLTSSRDRARAGFHCPLRSSSSQTRLHFDKPVQEALPDEAKGKTQLASNGNSKPTSARKKRTLDKEQIAGDASGSEPTEAKKLRRMNAFAVECLFVDSPALEPQGPEALVLASQGTALTEADQFADTQIQPDSQPNTTGDDLFGRPDAGEDSDGESSQSLGENDWDDGYEESQTRMLYDIDGFSILMSEPSPLAATGEVPALLAEPWEESSTNFLEDTLLFQDMEPEPGLTPLGMDDTDTEAEIDSQNDREEVPMPVAAADIAAEEGVCKHQCTLRSVFLLPCHKGDVCCLLFVCCLSWCPEGQNDSDSECAANPEHLYFL